MIGDRKSVYHSTLVSAGAQEVTIKKGPLKSNKGPGYYVIIEHEGDDQFLNLENENCVTALKGLVGRTVVLKASGAKKDATLEVTDSDGNAVVAAAGTLGSPIQDPKDAIVRWGRAAYMSLGAVEQIRDKWDGSHPKRPMTDEQFQALVSGLIIYLDRHGLIEAINPQAEVEKAAKEVFGE